MRIGEAPAHVSHAAVIGTGRANHVGILPLAVFVPGAQHRSTIAVSPGKRLPVIAIGVGLVIIGISMLSRVRAIAVKRLDGLLLPFDDRDRQA